MSIAVHHPSVGGIGLVEVHELALHDFFIQQIQKLEDELGEKLFDRSNREVKLTPHGSDFLRHAVLILEEAATAKREASDAKHLLRGTMKIGVLPTGGALRPATGLA